MAIPDSPITREEMYLEEIARKGGGLPPVETTDYGKYLRADDTTGELEWSEASGGYFDCTLTAKLNSVFQVSSWEIDKTYAEISAAIMSGTPVLVKVMQKGLWSSATDCGYTFAYYAYSATAQAYGVVMRVTGVDVAEAYEVFLSSADVISFSNLAQVDYSVYTVALQYDSQSGEYYVPNSPTQPATQSQWGSVIDPIKSGRVVELTYNNLVYHLCYFYQQSGGSYYQLKFVCISRNEISVLESSANVTGANQISLRESKAALPNRVKLENSGGNLVNTSINGMNIADYSAGSLRSGLEFYSETDEGMGVVTETRYTICSIKYGNVMWTCEIIIKDELTGNLWKHTGTGTLSFAPYTP